MLEIEGREGGEEEWVFGFKDELKWVMLCCLSLDEGFWWGIRNFRFDFCGGIVMFFCF